MGIHTSVGEAFVEGRCVAAVELEEEWIRDVVRMPIPGENTYGYKDLSHPGQAYLRISAVYDDAFEARLERLLEFASADVDRRRKIRDAGERSIAVDLVIDRSRNIIGARIDPPFISGAQLDEARFPVGLPS